MILSSVHSQKNFLKVNFVDLPLSDTATRRAFHLHALALAMRSRDRSQKTNMQKMIDFEAKLRRKEQEKAAKLAAHKPVQRRLLTRILSPIYFVAHSLVKEVAAKIPDVNSIPWLKRLLNDLDDGESLATASTPSFVYPTSYPPGTIRNFRSIGRAAGKTGYVILDDYGLAPAILALQRYRARSIWYKLGWLLGYLFLFALGVVFVAFFAQNYANRSTLVDEVQSMASVQAHDDLKDAIRYYTVQEFPNILALHPVFEGSENTVILVNDQVTLTVVEDEQHYAKLVKAQFSFPPSLDVFLEYKVDLVPSYHRRPNGSGPSRYRPPYEYVFTLEKYTLYFLREQKEQDVLPGDQYFPKRPVFSGTTYSKMQKDFLRERNRHKQKSAWEKERAEREMQERLSVRELPS